MALVDANLGEKPIDELAAVLVRRKHSVCFCDGLRARGATGRVRQCPTSTKPVKSEELLPFVDKVLLAAP